MATPRIPFWQNVVGSVKAWRKRLQKPMRQQEPPVEGQAAIVGQNRFGAVPATFGADGRMLAYRLDDVTMQDLDRVRQDPTVAASLRLLKLPILRANWQVYCEDEQVAAFVTEVLRPHIRQYLWAMCSAFDWGVVFIEKVWRREARFITSLTASSAPAAKRIEKRNAWVVDRVAHLDPGLSWAMVYPTGEFAGVRLLQADYIIPEGRIIHWAIDAEFNEVYGNPITKKALPYFELKQAIWADAARYLSEYAVPTKKGFAPPGRTPVGDPSNPMEIDNLEYLREQLDGLRSAHTIVLPSMPGPNGERLWDVEPFPVSPAISYIEYINALNEEMRQAMGVPSLASVHPMRGTYSLGQAQIDLFLQNEEAWLDQIEEVLNQQLIRDIIDYNFGSKAARAYLRLSINRMETQRMLEAFVHQLSMGQPIQTATGDLIVADWAKVAEDSVVPYQVLSREDMAWLTGGGMGGAGMGGMGTQADEPYSGQEEPTDEQEQGDRANSVQQRWGQESYDSLEDNEFGTQREW